MQSQKYSYRQIPHNARLPDEGLGVSPSLPKRPQPKSSPDIPLQITQSFLIGRA